MARRRRKGDRSEESQPERKAPVDATTSLGTLLKAANVHASSGKPGKPALGERARTSASRSPEPHRPAPPPPPTAPSAPAPPSATELRLLNDAYAGAQPLSPKKIGRQIVTRPVPRPRVSDEDRAAEQAARKRLAALVSGGVHFKVQRDDAFVQAYRSEASSKVVAKLGGQGFVPEATLDLHGERAAGVADNVAGFVRIHHRRGARHLLVIVGKGLHSEDGTGVLLPALIDALTQGLCAPLVRGFATAHARLGGTGAVAVLLI